MNVFLRLAIFLITTATALLAQNRIVSTSPAITETLFALGLGERVVGVSEYCHYPPEVASRTKVGSYLRPNVETIVRLKPDLVIVERLPNNAMEQLKTAGMRVNQVLLGNVQDNLRMMEAIAVAANSQDRGKALTAKVRTALDRVRTEGATHKRKTCLFIVGRTPGQLEGMVAVGKGSYLNELITLAGGRNMLAESAAAYPKISLETVVRLQPDVIIDMGDMAQTEGVTEQHKRSVEQLWKARADIRSRVHAVASDIFVVPGPRMVDAARAFEQLLHGDMK
jgi:iron complex transport system substrate-binding protein